MKAELAELLRQLHYRQHEFAIIYFYSIIFIWKYCERFRWIFTSTVFIGMTTALAVLTIVTFGITLIFYLQYPNYPDHAQPLVASISWEWMHGHVLYPNWTTGDASISIYGPLLFLINGLALLLNSSIFCTKLVGVLFLCLALIAILIAIKQTTGSSLTSLVLVASLVTLFGIFDEYSYWNRPEPFLITIGVLALVVIAYNPPPPVAAISIGVLAGFATGLKLHGFIYLIPAAAITVARTETLRRKFVVTIIGGLCATAFALLPYFGNGVSIVGYLRILRVVSEQEWVPALFIENVLVFFVLTAALTVTWIWRQQAFEYWERWFFAGVFVSAAMIVLIGAKRGAGGYWLLPLVPVFIYGIAIGCTESVTAAGRGMAALIFLGIFLAYGPNLLIDMWHTYQANALKERDKITEFRNYVRSYPDAQIGVSDYEHYESYFYRVLSVWNGQPLHVDFTAWMDLAYGGVDEKYITRFVERCTVKTWILPVGNPFMLENFYNGLPLVSDNFRRTFFTNYRQIAVGDAYQVWQCNQ
jgi:hypothetical protein